VTYVKNQRTDVANVSHTDRFLPRIVTVMADDSSALTTEQRAYIERVLTRTLWTATELARRAALDHSTLSRFIAGGREGHALRHSTIRKIENASGIAFDAQGFSESEASPVIIAEAGVLAPLIQAAILGRENTDAWLLNSRALENLGYRVGDTLIVELGLQPVPQDIVCAQVYDWQNGRSETLFRLFQPPYLLAASNDASLMRPLLVDESAVSIKGVVTLQLRPRGAFLQP
jgi:transcriptional regulator with XRE-family HTH domain